MVEAWPRHAAARRWPSCRCSRSRLRELRARGDAGGAGGHAGRGRGHPQLRGRGAAVRRDRALPRRRRTSCRRSARASATGPRSRCSTCTASAPTRRGTAPRCARTWPTSLGLDIRAPRPKRIVIASPQFPDQDLGEINVTRLTDERAPARPAVLRADLVADHPARQGPDRVRQGAGLRPAPRGGEPGDAHLRQRRRPRPPGLCRAEARADPGRGDPVDLLGGLAQLERAAGADRGHLLRRRTCRASAAGWRWTTSS